MKTVLGIIGLLAAGKDSLAKLMSQDLGWALYQISSPLKIIAQERGTERDREYLVQLGREIAHREGDDYLARYFVEKAPEQHIILTGMRQLGQIEYLRKNTELFLVAIDVEQKIRFERLKIRKKGGDPLTWESFLEIESADNSTDEAQKIGECMKLADYTYNNNGSFEEMKKQVSVIKDFFSLSLGN